MAVKHHLTPIRVCFFGDSFVNGTGDDACLGWVGRACAISRQNGRDLTCYNLGIRRDTSTDVRTRWRREAEARLPPEHDGRLVFSLGANDCCVGEDGIHPRVDVARAVANAQDILATAQAWRPTLMVGPPPVGDLVTDERIANLAEVFSIVCASLGLPYLNVFHIASGSTTWAQEAAAGDGVHPNEGGYALIAAAFQQWAPWSAWNSA